jgi:nucleotidyltransferase substrate binding protein (TIGR01987 family)
MDVRIQALGEAVDGFVYLAQLDWNSLAAQMDPRIIDGLENGMVQKFEYTVELCWKTIKTLLKDLEGIDEASPKKVVKAWYTAGHLTENEYLGLLEAIDDRNRLSHVYDHREFREMLGRMSAYAALFLGITRTLQEKI